MVVVGFGVGAGVGFGVGAGVRFGVGAGRLNSRRRSSWSWWRTNRC